MPTLLGLVLLIVLAWIRSCAGLAPQSQDEPSSNEGGLHVETDSSRVGEPGAGGTETRTELTTVRHVTFVWEGRPVAGVVVRRLPAGSRAAAPAAAPIVAVADEAGRAALPPIEGANELVALVDGFVAAAVPRDEPTIELQRTLPILVHVTDARGACADVRIMFATTRSGRLPPVDVDLVAGEFAIPAADPRSIFCAVSGLHSPLAFRNAPPGRFHLAIDAKRPFVVRGIEGWPPGLALPAYRADARPKEIRVEVGEWHAAVLHGVGDRILDARLSHERPDDLHDGSLYAMHDAEVASLRAAHPETQVLVRARKHGEAFEDRVQLLTERGGIVVRTVTFTPVDLATVQNVLLDGAARSAPVRLTIEPVDEDGVPFHELPFLVQYARTDGGTIDVPMRGYEPRALPPGPVTLGSSESFVVASLGSQSQIELSGAEQRLRVVVRRSHRLLRVTAHARDEAGAPVEIATRIQQVRRHMGRVTGSIVTHRVIRSGGTFEAWLEPIETTLTLSANGHREIRETIVIEPGATPFAFTRTLERGK